jgi:hypothetical protein
VRDSFSPKRLRKRVIRASRSLVISVVAGGRILSLKDCGYLNHWIKKEYEQNE